MILAVGCQTNPKFAAYDEKVDENMGMGAKIPLYFWDRFLDLTDVAQVNLGFGDGFLVNAHATKWMQLGAGYRDAVCFGFMPRSFGMWYDNRTEGGIAVPPFMNLYYKEQCREALWGSSTLFNHDVSYKGADYLCNDTAHWSDFGVSLHFFLIGLDVNVSPFQVFDAFFGFLGMPFLIPIDPIGFGTEIDVGNDDLRARNVRNASDLNYYNYTLGKSSCGGGSK
ncbi:MAG: hypothetical protein KJ645_12945 [Planctomycetes bacterium]|nr:hypothetical protein [Planctomycetota bacterium]